MPATKPGLLDRHAERTLNTWLNPRLRTTERVLTAALQLEVLVFTFDVAIAYGAPTFALVLLAAVILYLAAWCVLDAVTATRATRLYRARLDTLTPLARERMTGTNCGSGHLELAFTFPTPTLAGVAETLASVVDRVDDNVAYGADPDAVLHIDDLAGLLNLTDRANVTGV